MALPRFTSDSQPLTQMQSQWATQLEPVIAFPPNKGLLLKDVSLNNGVTVINHKLGRKPQGYLIADINSAATIYRSEPFNDLTLTLTSNAATTVTLWVF